MRFVSALFAALLILTATGCGPSQPATAASEGQQETQKPATEDTVDQMKEDTVTASTLSETEEPDSSVQEMKEEAPAKTPAALPKLWDFWATWCPPCREQSPIIEELAEEYSGVVEISSIDVDQNKELSGKFKVQAIPTLVFLDAEGNEVSRRVGLFPKDSIVARLKAHGFIQ